MYDGEVPAFQFYYEVWSGGIDPPKHSQLGSDTAELTVGDGGAAGCVVTASVIQDQSCSDPIPPTKLRADAVWCGGKVVGGVEGAI